MHTIKDALGDRMKRYENISRNYLTRRIPVIIRLDGRAFHSFTRGFEKPFDKVFMKAMQLTTKYLCENIQGCVLGYTQSDEITLVLTDYATPTTDAWFGYNIQKIVSISASMATIAFKKYFEESEEEYFVKLVKEDIEAEIEAGLVKEYIEAENVKGTYDKVVNQIKVYKDALLKDAMFDSRAFSIPKEEVVNCLIWRQQDATRNSIQSVAQHYFSHNQIMNKNCSELQDMLMLEKNVNWNDYSVVEKRGTCCIKVPVEIRRETSGDVIAIITRNKWIIDENIPIFTQDKKYINDLL